jgi:hypothetical protein
MNIKTLTIALAVALGSTTAFASEATQFSIEAPTLTRAEVRADLARSIAAGEQNVRGESYGSFSPSDIMSTRNRAETRADAGLRASMNANRRDYTGG